MSAGQLTTTQAALTTVAPNHPISVLFYNGDSVNELVTVQIIPSGGTAYTLAAPTLATGESMLIANIPLGAGDVVQAAAGTNSNQVNYFVYPAQTGSNFDVKVFDSNNRQKMVSIPGTGVNTNNLTGTVDPVPTNDNTQGYGVGSLWFNTTSGRSWICRGASTGAAIWDQVTPPLGNFRNIVDGGDFTTNPWQRGTPVTSINTSVAYGPDRFFAAAAAGASSSITLTQVADTSINGFNQNCKVQRANSNSDTHAINFGQVLESADCIKAQNQQVTLSFWAKKGANYSGGALTVALNHSTTIGNDTAAHLVAASTNWQTTPTIINTTQVLTSAMVRYQFTGTVPATATQLGVLFTFTPTGTAGADDSISFQGIQLEIGASASPFEHRDIEVELALCQRFFFQVNEPGTHVVVGWGMVNATNNQTIALSLPTQMRAAPTVTITAGGFKINVAGTETAVGAGFAAGSTHTPNYITVVDNLTGTVGQSVLLVGFNSTGNIAISADF
jgi:hypothetical protein